jgi:hypothetical protein
MFREAGFLGFCCAVKAGIARFTPAQEVHLRANQDAADVQQKRQSLRFFVPVLWCLLVFAAYGLSCSELKFDEILQAQASATPWYEMGETYKRNTQAYVGELH